MHGVQLLGRDGTNGSSPRVAVIVLNWNGLDDTLACLQSLSCLDLPVHKVVVDNGSVDGSVPIIRERFPDVTIIVNGNNLGYTGGNNVGLQHAVSLHADYALLLNNDTEVAPDSVRLLVEAVEADEMVGIAGPTIYYYDQPHVIWSAGGAIDWQRGRTCMVGLNEPDRGQFSRDPRQVDFVTGCALLIKREALERIGPLDDRFFAYYEEAEWCVRAHRAGFKIVHAPLAQVWHKTSPEAQQDSPLTHYYMTRNRLLFLKVSGAGLRAWLHTLFAENLRTIASWSLRPYWRSKRVQRDIMLRALMDYSLKRFGKAPDGRGTEVPKAGKGRFK